MTAVRSGVDGQNAVFKPATSNTVLMFDDVILIADVERFADSF